MSLAFLCIWRVWHLCLLLSWCLFRVSWEFVGIPPTSTDLPSWQPVITRVSLITTYVLFKGKKPFPIYCCGPVFLIVPSQCQVLTFYLLLLSFIWSNMSHMWDFVVWYNTDALTINLMCHKKHLFILCLKYQGISYWLGLQWLMPGGWGNKAVLGSDWAFCASRSATKIPMTSFSRIERVFLLANGRKHPEPSWGIHWRASPVPPPHSWVQESTVVIEYWR